MNFAELAGIALIGCCLGAASRLAAADPAVNPRPSGGSGGTAGVFPDEKIEVKDLTRTYRLVVPRSLDPSRPAPLVFAFHGLGDTPERMSGYTHLEESAATNGFILVFPGGLLNRWTMILQPNDDLLFFDALLQHLAAKYNLDLNRVYATGMSNGAYFVNLLASQRSEQIAAIAPHSGGLGVLDGRGIRAKRKYPVFIIQGAADRIVPVEEGRNARDAYRREGHFVQYLEIPGLGHEWATRSDIDDQIWHFFQVHPRE